MYEYGRKRDYDNYGYKTSRYDTPYYSQAVRHTPPTYGNNIYGSYGRKPQYPQYRPSYQGYRGQGYGMGNILDKRIIALIVGTLLVMACIGIVVYIALPRENDDNILIQTEIRFNGTYDPDMSVPGTAAYNNLKQTVCPDITTIPNAIGCELVDVREGSFLLKVIILFLRSVGEDEAADALESHINGKTTIGGLTRLNTVVATPVSAASTSLGCNEEDSTGQQWPCYFGSVCTDGELVSHRCQCEAVHAAGDDCNVCAEGYYRDTSGTPHICRACPVNTYKPTTGNGTSASCLACTGGTTTNGETGRKSLTDCQSGDVDPSQSGGGVDPTTTGGGGGGATNTGDVVDQTTTGGGGGGGGASNTEDGGDPTTTGGDGGASNTEDGGDASSSGDGGASNTEDGGGASTSGDGGASNTEDGGDASSTSGDGGGSSQTVDDSDTASIDATATSDGMENTDSVSNEEDSSTAALDGSSGSSDDVQSSESSLDQSDTMGATESMSLSETMGDSESNSSGDTASETRVDNSSSGDESSSSMPNVL